MRPRVVISGGSGLIGSSLIAALEARGYEITQLVRRPETAAGQVQWNPGAAPLDPQILDGAAALIALGGASVGRLPWTKKYRHKLLDSRIAPTHTLTAALHELGPGAPRLISASAVGYYGSAPGMELTERSAPGTTFLAQLCVAWEAAAREAESVTDVSVLRTAPVIHRDGVLKPMMLLTKLGLAGPLGGGRQFLPWISLDDEVGAIIHVLENQIFGPINLAGPTPATANDLGRALAKQMNRPFWLPTPSWLLNLALSKAATQSLLTADSQVVPEVLKASGFEFAHPTVVDAVGHALS